MYTGLFYLQAAIQFALLLWLLRIRRNTSAVAATVLLLPQLGLVYDNLIVALGSSIGLGALLQALSWPRFWIHWLCGTWLIIAAGSILRLARFGWAQSRAAMASFCVLAVGLTALELSHLWTAKLYPVCEKGLLRYSTAVTPAQFCQPDQLAVAGQFPLPAIITCLVVVIAGAVLLWRRGFPWMFIGGVLMFLSAAPPAAKLKLDNLGEIFIAGGCIWAVAHFARPRATP